MIKSMAMAEAFDGAGQFARARFSSERFGAVVFRFVVTARRVRRLVRGQLRNARKLLTLTTAAVGLAVVASTAQAEECVGGFRTIEDKIFPCVEAGTLGQFGARAEAIGDDVGAAFDRRASLPVTAPPAMAKKATTPQDCQPGGYWYLQTEEAPQTEVPMACR
jgi:hypothetical protein